jgi:type VI secretion system protein ImpF
MAEPGAGDRLQPALLDRLIDAEPARQQESREARCITKGALREAVLRDLGWLFNSVRPAGAAELAGHGHVQRSVLNYGLPALSGATAAGLDRPAVERAIRQAVLDFEPRILPGTLRVEALAQDALVEHHNIVSIRISGHLWAQPVPLELLLRTDVDLETGTVEIRDLGKGA